ASAFRLQYSQQSTLKRMRRQPRPTLFPYTTLFRSQEGWISSFWGDSENNRRAKYYRMTKAGRKQLEVETKRWGRVSWAIAQALRSEEHTSELQSPYDLVCRLLLEKKKSDRRVPYPH